MSDTDLIDWEQLEMVFGDEEDFDEDMAELFEEFMEDAVDHFEKIAAEDFESNRESVAKLSHKLKGSGANFGFAGMARNLASIEDGIADLTKEQFDAFFAQAQADYKSSVEQVKAKYPGLSA